MGFKLQKFNSKRRKMADKMVFLIRILTVVMALAIIPIPMKISATEEKKTEEKEVSETEKETELDIAPKEPEETSEKEEPEPDSTEAPKASETQKETEPETTREEETESDSTEASKESETQKESEPETKGEEEPEPDSTEAPKESETQKETKPETKGEEETKAAASVPKESEPLKKTETETGSKETKETVPREIISREVKIFREEVPSAVEIKVPLYNYEVVNIVAPAKYAVALNPYKLAVRTGEDEVSTEQVVSRKYGLLNKSSTDKIVRVTFVVEDLNEGKVVFVDSAEEAQEADEDVYAVYLAAVPADDSGIWIDGEMAGCDTTGADLSDVEMNGAADYALPLGEGENTLSFKLSKAVYNFEDGRELTLEEDDEGEGSLELLSLAAGEGGITAFTFTGAMNPKADWGKLLNGIKISAIYTYETATGEEEILEGTGALIETE